MALPFLVDKPLLSRKNIESSFSQGVRNSRSFWSRSTSLTADGVFPSTLSLTSAESLLRGRPKYENKASVQDESSVLSSVFDRITSEDAAWRNVVEDYNTRSIRGPTEIKQSVVGFQAEEGDEDELRNLVHGSSGGTGVDAFSLPEKSVTGYRTPWYTIHPQHPSKILFDLGIGALIVYSVVAVPFRIAFELMDDPALFISDCVIDSLFGLDIFLTFCTAYFDDELGGFETDPRKIAKLYAKGFFLIDFVSTVPFELLTSGVLSFLQVLKGAGSIARTARILRVAKLMRLLKFLRIAKLQGKSASRPENDPKE